LDGSGRSVARSDEKVRHAAPDMANQPRHARKKIAETGLAGTMRQGGPTVYHQLVTRQSASLSQLITALECP
jgi:hypothetical protein